MNYITNIYQYIVRSKCNFICALTIYSLWIWRLMEGLSFMNKMINKGVFNRIKNKQNNFASDKGRERERRQGILHGKWLANTDFEGTLNGQMKRWRILNAPG